MNTKSDVTFKVLRFEELPLEKKIRILSIRSKNTQYGVKLLVEIDGGHLFLPLRYHDLFFDDAPITENFFMKTRSVYMTILGFHHDKFEGSGDPDQQHEYTTPVLHFSKENFNTDRKRQHTSAPKKTGNSSMDALSTASKAFETANPAVGRAQYKTPPPPPHVRALNFDVDESGSYMQ